MPWSATQFPETIRKTKVGRENQILSADIQPFGRFPVVDQGQAFIAGYSDAEEKVIRDDLPLVVFGDHTRCLKYVDFPFILGADGTKVLKPKEDLFDTKFFYYALLNLDIPNRGYNRHFTLLKEKNVPRPGKDEQLKIAGVLGVVQRAIEQQDQLLQLAGELKRTLLHQLFSHGSRSEPRAETEIGLIPESWAVKPLGECCHVLSGSLSYTDFLDLPPADTVESVECMGVKVSDMNLPGNEIRFVSANAQKRLPLALAQKKLIPPDAVVFPKRGAAIATNKKRLTTTWTVLDPNLIAVSPRNGIDSEFLFYWAQTFDLKTITDPGPTPQLNKKDLMPLLMPVPPDIEEQRNIATALSTLEAKIELNRRRQSSLQELFHTLLHQLMTAKMSVRDLDLSRLESTAAA